MLQDGCATLCGVLGVLEPVRPRNTTPTSPGAAQRPASTAMFRQACIPGAIVADRTIARSRPCISNLEKTSPVRAPLSHAPVPIINTPNIGTRDPTIEK